MMRCDVVQWCGAWCGAMQWKVQKNTVVHEGGFIAYTIKKKKRSDREIYFMLLCDPFDTVYRMTNSLHPECSPDAHPDRSAATKAN